MPTAADPAVTLKFAVAVPFAGGVTGLGLTVHTAPAGHPEIVRLTALLNPPVDVTEIVDVAAAPLCTTVREEGFAETV